MNVFLACAMALMAMTEPPPPPFCHCYLGSVGPAGCPLAVFKRGDEIVNARVGDIVDGCTIVDIRAEIVQAMAPSGRTFALTVDASEICAPERRCEGAKR